MPDPNLAVAESAATVFEHAVDAADAATTSAISAALAGNALLAILPDLVFIWRKKVSEIPAGWHLCDGSTHNGVVTVDLRDKFIIGASVDDGGLNSQATTVTGAGTLDGGLSEVTLTAAESGLPAHAHTHPAVTNVTVSDVRGSYMNVANWSAGNTGTVSAATASEAHENLPPYYALCFIQYVGV
jgi:hypothetical protein